MRLCRRGDESAWRELVERHTRRVFNLAYRFTGRADEAEDLTQEIFVKVYLNLDRYREEQGAAFTTWLTAVGRNLAIDRHRRRREELRRRAEDPEILERAADQAEDLPSRLAREETATIVRRGIQVLPVDLREVIVLCDLQGMAYEEAARALGVPLGTVKSRLNRGRLELAKRLLARRGDLGEPS